MYFEAKITKPGPKAYPFQAFVQLRLSMVVKPSDGDLIVGPELMTPREVDELVDRLRSELEAFGREAKSALQTQAARTLSVLRERFGNRSHKSGGATPTTALFKGKEIDFPTGKEAYVWLVERYRDHKPGLLDDQSGWHERAFKGSARRYFSCRPADLFPPHSSLGE